MKYRCSYKVCQEQNIRNQIQAEEFDFSTLNSERSLRIKSHRY